MRGPAIYLSGFRWSPIRTVPTYSCIAHLSVYMPAGKYTTSDSPAIPVLSILPLNRFGEPSTYVGSDHVLPLVARWLAPLASLLLGLPAPYPSTKLRTTFQLAPSEIYGGLPSCTIYSYQRFALFILLAVNADPQCKAAVALSGLCEVFGTVFHGCFEQLVLAQ